LSSFLILFIAHSGASILRNSNVFAFSVYLSFFDVIGILLIILTWSNWEYKQPLWKQIMIMTMVCFVSLGIAYAVSTKETFWGRNVEAMLLKRALTFEKGSLGFASWRWWEVLYSRFGWSFSFSMRVVGTVVFSLILILIITLGIIIYKYINSRKRTSVDSNPIIPTTLVVFLIIGILCSPTGILGGGRKIYDCHRGVITTYEDAIDLLTNFVEQGDSVYWIGSDTQPILLGLIEKKNIELFPPQLNSQYSFWIGGDPDQLSRAGFWNEELANEWIKESNVLLFEDQALSGWFSDIDLPIVLNSFQKVGETSEIGCSAGQRISVYRRSQ
jgi:hypothetical protein